MMTDIKKLYKISKKLNVLYVEDDLLLRKRTANIFKGIFNSVDNASNGKEALDLYEQYYKKNLKYYDILISDIKMPFMDGLELCKIILQINKSQTIVITSAYNDPDELIEFINLGIKKFIKKPFKTDNLLEVLDSLCSEFDSNDDESEKLYLDDDYFWDLKTNQLFKNNSLIKLSFNETVVLKLFINNQNIIFSNYDIIQELEDLNINNTKPFSQDLVKSLIKRLRKKIPENMIENIYSRGYKFKLK